MIEYIQNLPAEIGHSVQILQGVFLRKSLRETLKTSYNHRQLFPINSTLQQ